MRPVIPKVRVGDILLGTKNLRNWLQTASLLGYINQLASHGGQTSKTKRDRLYAPTKKDRFVVAVNAWETFAVWGLDRDVVVLFCNPVKGVRGIERYGQHSPEDPVMNPALFAQWFIRTRGKRPDLLGSWPDHAYYLWASLQMNGISSPLHPLTYMVPPGVNSPFALPLHRPNLAWSPKNVIRERVHQVILQGLIRNKQRRRFPVGGRAYGPSLQDIPRWQTQIHKVTSNPRVVKKLKEKVPLEVPQTVFNAVVFGISANQ